MSATVLRPELLDGVALLLAAADPPSRFGEAVIARAAELRAAVDRVVVDPTGDEVAPRDTDVRRVGRRVARRPARRARRRVARAAPGRRRVDRGRAPGGQLLLLAPPPGDAGAEAARAGLENLARTLSIEWARHGIRPVAILPGAATEPEEVAELAAFLASPAGDYYSGCHFRLGET